MRSDLTEWVRTTMRMRMKIDEDDDEENGGDVAEPPAVTPSLLPRHLLPPLR
jgi:hypothetical protein